MAPGNSWGGAGVGVIFSHRTNSIGDSVRLWTITINSDNDIPISTSNFLPGTTTILTSTVKGIPSLKYVNSLGQ
jgi:hypothetical protein